MQSDAGFGRVERGAQSSREDDRRAHVAVAQLGLRLQCHRMLRLDGNEVHS
jgi:hypothetical protein